MAITQSYGQSKIPFIGRPVEDIKALNQTLSDRYYQNKGLSDNMDVMLQNINTLSDADKAVVKNQIDKTREAFKGFAEGGSWWNATGTVMKEAKDIQTHGGIQRVQSKYQQYQDYQKWWETVGEGAADDKTSDGSGKSKVSGTGLGWSENEKSAFVAHSIKRATDVKFVDAEGNEMEYNDENKLKGTWTGSFDGYKPGEKLNLDAECDKFLKDMKADKFSNSGISKGSGDKEGYFMISNGNVEQVTEESVRRYTENLMATDPKIQRYFQDKRVLNEASLATSVNEYGTLATSIQDDLLVGFKAKSKTPEGKQQEASAYLTNIFNTYLEQNGITKSDIVWASTQDETKLSDIDKQKYDKVKRGLASTNEGLEKMLVQNNMANKWGYTQETKSLSMHDNFEYQYGLKQKMDAQSTAWSTPAGALGIVNPNGSTREEAYKIVAEKTKLLQDKYTEVLSKYDKSYVASMLNMIGKNNADGYKNVTNMVSSLNSNTLHELETKLLEGKDPTELDNTWLKIGNKSVKYSQLISDIRGLEQVSAQAKEQYEYNYLISKSSINEAFGNGSEVNANSQIESSLRGIFSGDKEFMSKVDKFKSDNNLQYGDIFMLLNNENAISGDGKIITPDQFSTSTDNRLANMLLSPGHNATLGLRLKAAGTMYNMTNNKLYNESMDEGMFDYLKAGNMLIKYGEVRDTKYKDNGILADDLNITNIIPVMGMINGQYQLDITNGRKLYDDLNKFIKSTNINFDNYQTYIDGKAPETKWSDYLTSTLKDGDSWSVGNFGFTDKATVWNPKAKCYDYGLVFTVDIKNQKNIPIQKQITIPFGDINASNNLNIDGGALRVGQLYGHAKGLAPGQSYNTYVPVGIPDNKGNVEFKDLQVTYINGKDPKTSADDIVIFNNDISNPMPVELGNSSLGELINLRYTAISNQINK